MIDSLEDPAGNPIFYTGPPLSAGRLPAFFYFSLSAEQSLTLSPYNRPVQTLAPFPIRVFSFTLPGHGEGFNHFRALALWAEQMEKEGEAFLETFFRRIVSSIQWLAEKQIIATGRVALGGLSRGAFIASHLAARLTFPLQLVGWAPLTRLGELTEFKNSVKGAEKFDLIHLIPSLLYLHRIRFYIGNNDLQVGTDACYAFFRALAKMAHEKRARHCHSELFITHSIGFKGHGTEATRFEEGALWVKSTLLQEGR
jgi:hypothetical protein